MEVVVQSFASRWTLAIVLVAMAGGCTSTQPPAKAPVDQAAISAAIDSVNTMWTGAVAAKDSNAVASLYAEDAHLLPVNATRIDGREGIRQMWAGMFAMPGFDLRPVSNTKIISEAGDLVVDLGTYEFSGTDPKGKPMHETGKYVTALKKVNGEWKIVVDTFNGDGPSR
jgi:uncharacterized protein (TIGR02246 family)